MRANTVLASSSPRRQALLAGLGVAFEVDAADVDESPRPGESPEDLVMRLSCSKAKAVASRHPDAVVLAADTVVVLEGRILGKPGGPDEAAAMLRELRDRTHCVYTAVSVACGDAVSSRLSCSKVWMRPYSEAEIRAYVSTGDPLDKAGAYAIQHPIFSPVDRWEGCYSGIMGLPLGVAASLLGGAGVKVPVSVAATCEVASGRCCLRGSEAEC